jgi:hypothetical protein
VAALGVDFFDFEFRLRLESRLYEHGITLLELGQSIILEDGLWTRDERDRHREIARKLGATTEIHYFDLPMTNYGGGLKVEMLLGRRTRCR